MRLGSILIALTGLAVAGGSVLLGRDQFGATSAQASETPAPTVAVLVAAQDIGFGQAIERQAVTTIDWPVAALPAGVLTDPALLLPDPGEQPRRARRAIAQGELILASRVSDWGEKVTITQTLAPGSRAMAIKVEEETAVGGFVTPGDFVDVVLTQGQGDALRAVTILQDIRVIGVDQDADVLNDSPEVARTVTVEVTPDQGQRLALAQQAGTLSLTLRDLLGESAEAPAPIALADLLQEEPVAAPAPEPVAAAPAPEPVAPVRAVIVRRANVVSTETH